MIHIENLTKFFWVKGKKKYVVRDATAIFPDTTSVGLLGRNGAGKSTLLKILGGQMRPNYGSITSSGKISWQIGFAGSFHRELTGAQNVKFVARVYGVDTHDLCEYVNDFAQLGDSFYMPFRTYSSGMRARLAFGVSMGIPFSYYLIDEVTSVGDKAFRTKCATVLDERLNNAGAIVVSHSDHTLRRMCTAGAVLKEGKLHWFDDIEEAIAFHNSNM